MSSLNTVTLIGNLTRDIELKHTPSGAAVADTGIACNRVYKAGEEKREEVMFIDIQMWNRTAEVAAEYLKKGAQVAVTGYLKLDVWDDKQTGQKKSRHRVVVDKLVMLGGKRQESAPSDDDNPAPVRKAPPAQRPKPPADPDLDAQPDDIPF